ARSRRAKPEENKEVGCGGSLPRTAASAALSWATIRPPPWGSGKANQRAALDAAVASCLYSGARWRRASEPGRWATRTSCGKSFIKTALLTGATFGIPMGLLAGILLAFA